MTSKSNQHDREAFLRFANGDEYHEAFEQALPELDRQIRKYLLFFGLRGELLEDLAQEAIVRFYLNRITLCGMGEAPVKVWIRTVCRNLLIDVHRLRRKYRCLKAGKTSLSDSDTRTEPPRPSENPGRNISPEEVASLENDPDLREILDLCVDRLPQENRTILELRYMLDLPTSEIAEVFDKGVRMIQTKLKHTRESLADCMRFHGYAIKS